MLGLLLIKLIFLLFSIGGIALVMSFLAGLLKVVYAIFISGISITNEQVVKVPYFIKKKLVKSALGDLSSGQSNSNSPHQNSYDNHADSSKLTLSHHNKMVAGVFGGIAEYLGLSAVVLRIVFVGAVLYFGVYLVIFYVLAIFFMKKYET